jgi:ketosteroid isomerase-like protein
MLGIISVVLVLISCALEVRGPGPITKDEVLEVLDEVEEASRALDADGVMRFMAEDVEISLTARGPMGTTKQTMDRKAYEREIRLGMALIKNYDLRRKLISLDISSDGQSAVVVLEIYEVAEMMNIKVTAISTETSLIVKRDGKLRFLKIEAEAEMSAEPMDGGPQKPEGQGI